MKYQMMLLEDKKVTHNFVISEEEYIYLKSGKWK